MALSCTLVKWLTAGRAIRLLNYADILSACLTVRNTLASFQSNTAPQAALRKENTKEDRPEFYSEDIAHYCNPSSYVLILAALRAQISSFCITIVIKVTV